LKIYIALKFIDGEIEHKILANP